MPLKEIVHIRKNIINFDVTVFHSFEGPQEVFQVGGARAPFSSFLSMQRHRANVKISPKLEGGASSAPRFLRPCLGAQEVCSSWGGRIPACNYLQCNYLLSSGAPPRPDDTDDEHYVHTRLYPAAPFVTVADPGFGQGRGQPTKEGPSSCHGLPRDLRAR